MKSVYLASPFFSPAQKERIAKVKAALSNNKTIDPKNIFIPHEHEYKAAEFGSLRHMPGFRIKDGIFFCD